MLGSSDLAPTGERVDREAIYAGEAVEVHPERYPKRTSSDRKGKERE